MEHGKRTALAQQAMDASDVIQMTFSKRVVGRDPPRTLLVKVPDGPSTGGGDKARQSITLAPQDGQGAAVMCGWLDVASRIAELRTYGAVAAQFQQRFKKAFDVPEKEYDELLAELERTLRNLQIDTRYNSAPRSLPGDAAGGPSGSRWLWLCAGLLVLGLAAVLVLAR